MFCDWLLKAWLKLDQDSERRLDNQTWDVGFEVVELAQNHWETWPDTVKVAADPKVLHKRWEAFLQLGRNMQKPTLQLVIEWYLMIFEWSLIDVEYEWYYRYIICQILSYFWKLVAERVAIEWFGCAQGDDFDLSKLWEKTSRRVGHCPPTKSHPDISCYQILIIDKYWTLLNTLRNPCFSGFFLAPRPCTAFQELLLNVAWIWDRSSASTLRNVKNIY